MRRPPPNAHGGLTRSSRCTPSDDGTLGWDQKVVDAWSGFRAPTDELTRSLRVRDLLGMGSGIGEPDRLKPGLHFDSVTAAQTSAANSHLPHVGGRPPTDRGDLQTGQLGPC